MEQISFSKLFETGNFSDFCLIINGEKKNLHRGILTERSLYFQEYFEKEPNSEYEIFNSSDLCFQHIDLLFKWLYGYINFHVSMDTFGYITQLALIFKVPTLINALLVWMNSNITGSNVMKFYFAVEKFSKELNPEFLEVIMNKIIKDFEVLEIKDIIELPFNSFYSIITNPSFISTSYRLSYSISTYLHKNSFINQEQQHKLIDLYLNTDWSPGLAQIFTKFDSTNFEKFLCYFAKHFRRFTNYELPLFTVDNLVRLLMRNDIIVYNEEYITLRIQEITNSISYKNKNDSRRLWQSLIRDGNQRIFLSPSPITSKNIRCLIIGSVYLDILLDIKKSLINYGFLSENIVCFNADISTPSIEFIYQFDSIFVFTHYQFQNSVILSDLLSLYIKNGGGLVYCYGFTRIDEWGCGEEGLIQKLPFSRASQVLSNPENDLKIIIKDHPIIKNINKINLGSFSPRSNIEIINDSNLIATYSDGIPLLAFKQNGDLPNRVVGINFYPVTSRIHRFGYDVNQTFHQIFPRSLLYSTGSENFE